MEIHVHCISIHLEFHVTVKYTFASKMLCPITKKYFLSYMDAKTLDNIQLHAIDLESLLIFT